MATLPAPATIIGGPVSPYVRKVLAVCEMKGVPYQVDPIVPFFGDEKFSELNPLRRVPVYIDDQVSVSDSTVICEYLDERYPTPALLPQGAADRARARWIEEFADTRMGDVFIWSIFNEAVINPSIWQRPRDKEKIARAVAEDLPEVMGHLEQLAPAAGFLFGAVTIADIAVAVFSAICAGRGWSRLWGAGPGRRDGSSAPAAWRRSPRSPPSPMCWRGRRCRSIAASQRSSACRSPTAQFKLRHRAAAP
jgi:glutathione S-transferase